MNNQWNTMTIPPTHTGTMKKAMIPTMNIIPPVNMRWPVIPKKKLLNLKKVSIDGCLISSKLFARKNFIFISKLFMSFLT
jgi:hypothetical protein